MRRLLLVLGVPFVAVVAIGALWFPCAWNIKAPVVTENATATPAQSPTVEIMFTPDSGPAERATAVNLEGWPPASPVQLDIN